MVRSNGDGSFAFEFPTHVPDLVVHLGDQLDTILDTDVPDLNRLFPTAYPHDPERDAGYQILARGELIDHRRNSLDVVRDTATARVLTEDQLTAWMHVVNDLRLVLGTRLDVSEDDVDLDDDDPLLPALEVYRLLGAVLSEIIEALTDTLPPPGDPDPLD
jgi:hypothetical protein